MTLWRSGVYCLHGDGDLAEPVNTSTDAERNYKQLTQDWAVWIVLLQVFTLGLTWVMAPGYLIGLTHPIIRLIYIGCCAWELIGIAIMYYLPFRSSLVYELVGVVFLIVFALPVTLAPMLGPAELVLPRDLGPVFRH